VKNINDVAAIDTMARMDVAVVDPVYPTSYDEGAYQRIQAVVFGIALAGFHIPYPARVRRGDGDD